MGLTDLVVNKLRCVSNYNSNNNIIIIISRSDNNNNNNNIIIIISCSDDNNNSNSNNNNNNPLTKYIKSYTFLCPFLFFQFYRLNYYLLNLNNYS